MRATSIVVNKQLVVRILQLVRIRWWIFAFMFAFPMLTYTQRTSLNVAAERIIPEFHLTQMQVGWMMWAYTVAYTLLQIPSGVIGERWARGKRLLR